MTCRPFKKRTLGAAMPLRNNEAPLDALDDTLPAALPELEDDTPKKPNSLSEWARLEYGEVDIKKVKAARRKNPKEFYSAVAHAFTIAMVLRANAARAGFDMSGLDPQIAIPALFAHVIGNAGATSIAALAGGPERLRVITHPAKKGEVLKHHIIVQMPDDRYWRVDASTTLGELPAARLATDEEIAEAEESGSKAKWVDI